MSDDGTNGIAKSLDHLRLAVESMNSRADARHEGVCSQLSLLHTGLEGVRSAQVEHGQAIAALQAACASRGQSCSEIHSEQRRHIRSHSEELDRIRDGVREVSQVTAIDGIKRAHLRKVAVTVWAVAWKVLVAAGALGLLGTAAAEVFKIMK